MFFIVLRKRFFIGRQECIVTLSPTLLLAVYADIARAVYPLPIFKAVKDFTYVLALNEAWVFWKVGIWT